MCFKQIPEDICKKITASVNMGDFYSIEFVQCDEIFGNATICLYKGSGIHNLHLIETYAHLASIALQKQVAEEALNESKKKQVEEALKNSETYLLKIFNSTQSGLVVIDPETYTIFDANSTAIELIGTEKSAIVGSSCKKWFCPAGNEPCPVMDLGQQIVRSECVLFNTRGERKPIIKTVVPVQLGRREYLLESFVDITEHRKAEEALRESEEFNRGLVDHLPDYLVVYGSDGMLLYVNPASARVLRYDADKLIGTPLLLYVAEEYRDKVVFRMAERRKGSRVSPYEIDILTQDGSRRSVIVKGTQIQYKDNPAILLLLIDITPRKRVEDADRESAKR
jgi:PAS domain S-box-containing protein